MKIDKGVPIPDRIAKRVSIGPLPLSDLNVGDSILVECSPEEMTRVLHAIRVRIIRYKEKDGKVNFSSTKESKGVRVWRTK